MAKRGLRKALRELLGRVDAGERKTASRLACRLLRQQPQWQQAGSVLLFCPMRDELDLWEMAGEALASGRRLALPRFARERQEYEAAWVRDLEREVVEGAFGIREPAPACPAFPLNRLDFSAVPGLGFDASGRRLGRGKGYYDRLLTGVTGVTCGVGYDFQVVDAVPCGPLDVVLNCILTPTRWFRASLRADL